MMSVRACVCTAHLFLSSLQFIKTFKIAIVLLFVWIVKNAGAAFWNFSAPRLPWRRWLRPRPICIACRCLSLVTLSHFTVCILRVRTSLNACMFAWRRHACLCSDGWSSLPRTHTTRPHSTPLDPTRLFLSDWESSSQTAHATWCGSLKFGPDFCGTSTRHVLFSIFVQGVYMYIFLKMQ